MKNTNQDSSLTSENEASEDTLKPTYFGDGFGYLDIFALRYCWFGAVWQWHGGVRLIMGYWFADSQEELMRQTEQSGWIDVLKADKNEVKEIYLDIRREQARQDWERRTILSLSILFRKPWREMKPGWYIIRSRSQFPLIASCIRKSRWFIWLEHVRVCENLDDMKNFTYSINQKHGISLHLEADLKTT